MAKALSIEIDQTSLKDALLKLGIKRTEIDHATDAYLLKLAHDIEATAKQLVPVDEGDLRTTIRVESDKDNIAVVAGGIPGRSTGKFVNYAEPVEFGTFKMPAQPFMLPAAEEAKLKVEAELSRILSKIV